MNKQVDQQFRSTPSGDPPGLSLAQFDFTPVVHASARKESSQDVPDGFGGKLIPAFKQALNERLTERTADNYERRAAQFVRWCDANKKEHRDWLTFFAVNPAQAIEAHLGALPRSVQNSVRSIIVTAFVPWLISRNAVRKRTGGTMLEQWREKGVPSFRPNAPGKRGLAAGIKEPVFRGWCKALDARVQAGEMGQESAADYKRKAAAFVAAVIAKAGEEPWYRIIDRELDSYLAGISSAASRRTTAHIVRHDLGGWLQKQQWLEVPAATAVKKRLPEQVKMKHQEPAKPKPDPAPPVPDKPSSVAIDSPFLPESQFAAHASAKDRHTINQLYHVAQLLLKGLTEEGVTTITSATSIAIKELDELHLPRGLAVLRRDYRQLLQLSPLRGMAWPVDGRPGRAFPMLRE